MIPNDPVDQALPAATGRDLQVLLTTPVTSTEEALQWYVDMAAADHLMHPDDPGAELIVFQTQEPVFTAEQAVDYDLRMEEVFQHLEDPYGIALELYFLANPAERP